MLNNKDHVEKVYYIVKDNVASKYEIFKGTHFEIYGKGRMQAIKMALEWFDKHL